jgi:hypothetical protein
VVRTGKAQLHHTINLIRSLVHETKGDTRKLAAILKGNSLRATCRNIWHFVYEHIRYRKDQPGVEQVRRPARSWADRRQGVDCDCYTVFISSILLNLGISHRIRITKYGGKKHFQHIYPVVPTERGYITLDCVTDAFDYEVPYSEKRDFDMQEHTPVAEIMGFPASFISGVDTMDLLGITTLKQPQLSLREVRKSVTERAKLTIKPVSTAATQLTVRKLSNTTEYLNEDYEKGAASASAEQPSAVMATAEKPLKHWWKVLIAVGAGYGAFRLIGNK